MFCDRNFVEWHGGIEEYGFWAIGINDLKWVLAFKSARAQLSPFLYPGYHPAPHITLVPSGLLEVNHFSKSHLHAQMATLRQARLKSFLLWAGH